MKALKSADYNRKLQSELKGLTLSLPVVVTCPGSDPKGICAKCYGKRGNYAFKNVKESSQANLDVYTINPIIFEIGLCGQLQRERPNYVRLHVTGDFFSQEYLEMWARVCEKYPSVKFYAYTKSHHLDFNNLDVLDNVRIIRSTGSKFDSLLKSHHNIVTYHQKQVLEQHDNRDVWLNDKRDTRHEVEIIFDVPTHSAHEFVLAIH